MSGDSEEKYDVVIVFSKNCTVALSWVVYLSSVVSNIFSIQDRPPIRYFISLAETLLSGRFRPTENEPIEWQKRSISSFAGVDNECPTSTCSAAFRHCLSRWSIHWWPQRTSKSRLKWLIEATAASWLEVEAIRHLRHCWCCRLLVAAAVYLCNFDGVFKEKNINKYIYIFIFFF